MLSISIIAVTIVGAPAMTSWAYDLMTTEEQERLRPQASDSSSIPFNLVFLPIALWNATIFTELPVAVFSLILALTLGGICFVQFRNLRRFSNSRTIVQKRLTTGAAMALIGTMTGIPLFHLEAEFERNEARVTDKDLNRIKTPSGSNYPYP
ncbi:hypothetical protein V2O64_01835 [Verrucomicrobiaceae bacterium 227]